MSSSTKFNINPSGYTNCFTGSHKSNIVSVMAEAWNCTIAEAIRRLYHKEYVPIVIPQIATTKVDIEKNKRIQEEFDKSVKFVDNLLKNGHISDNCLQYFAQDGITKDTLDFLGVCSIDKGWLAGRAIIPFINELHEICGFVAVNFMGKDWWIKHEYDKLCRYDSKTRIEDVEKNYRKTFYSPGFRSGNHLYGLYEVLNGDPKIDRLVIVEGERDAIKLLQEGIDCVSIHGTSLKEWQMQTLISMPNLSKVYIGLDMDNAGRNGAKIIQQKLMPYYDSVKVLDFPDGKDPKRFSGQEINQIIKFKEASK